MATAARHGIAAEELMGFGGAPNFANDANQVFEIGPKPVQVRHAATGVMLADVSVFSALTKAFPEKRYKPNLTYQPNLELLLERGSAEGPFPTRRKTKWKMILAAIWRKK